MADQFSRELNQLTGGLATTADQASRSKDQIARAVLRGLARRWKQVVIFGVLTAAAVGFSIWMFLPPPKPSASAQMYMPLKPPTALGGEHPDPPLERQTQSALIKSRLVLNAAIRPAEINNLAILKEQPDPIDWLITNLKVEFQGPEIIRISLSCEDGEQARILVDAVKDSYLKEIINDSSTRRAERRKLLEKLEAEQKQILLRKRQTINELAVDGSDTDRIRFQQQLMKDQMQAARIQLIRLESELKTGRLEEEYYAAEATGDISDLILNPAVDADPVVVDSQNRLKIQELAYEGILSRAADPKSKTVLDEEEKLKAKRKEHEELRSKVREKFREQAKNQTKMERAAKHQAIRQKNLILEQQVRLLKNELEEYSKTLGSSVAVSKELDPFRFEIKQTEDLLIKIERDLMTLKIEADTPPRVQELEKAVITKVDEQKRKALFAGGGAGLSLMIVLALIGLLEYRQRRVDSPDAITQGYGLRVFGTVPSPVGRSGKWWKTAGDDYRIQAHCEAISAARATLLHDDALSPHRIFMITSPVSGEGKTTLTMHLASSVAWSGRRTLLVDGDLRKPTLHERFGLAATPGLCEVLRGEASLFEVVQNTSIPGLMFIPAGNWTPETSEALVTPQLGHLFGIFRGQFEFVLVDSSPALPVTDALIMGRHADGVILSLLKGVSRVPQAIETRNRFQSVGVRVLGAFVSGAAPQGYGDTSKYYRGWTNSSNSNGQSETL